MHPVIPYERQQSPKPSRPLWDDVLITFEPDAMFVKAKTYDRQHGRHGHFLIAYDKLVMLLDGLGSLVDYDEDCGNYVKIIREIGSLHFCFTWLNYCSNDQVNGFRQIVIVPLPIIQQALEGATPVKYLYISQAKKTKINAFPATRTVHELQKHKRIRRAFSKAMRDCFCWPEDIITLYRDGAFNFYFTTKSGFPKNGGLILHGGTKHGYPYIYYSVHT